VPRLTRIYTRTGDDGTTAIAGGHRLSKAALRVETYGTVDELNSVIGRALAGKCSDDVRALLRDEQNTLFHLGSDLCQLESEKADRPAPRIEERHVHGLEAAIDGFSAELSPLENFILPGGTPTAAELHVARTVCRRAERLAVALADKEEIGEWVIRYLNRLSDLLFTVARVENKRQGAADELWDSRA
jgi:cob(I)alamin adenosyltransferase